MTPFTRPAFFTRRRFFARHATADAQHRGRIGRALRQEVQAGLGFAFYARTIAVVAISAWLVTIVPAPRIYYYLSIAFLFFLLGLVPHLLRSHRHIELIKLVFIVFDVALLVAVILVPPPFQNANAIWPMQTRLRFPDYLYLLVYLCGSALSYSPRQVLWSGFAIVATWSFGIWIYLNQPDTVTIETAAAHGVDTSKSEETLKIFLDPHVVWVSDLRTQIVLTIVMTGLLAAAVWRARTTMTRQVQAETAWTNLARYVSPDLADTLATAKTTGLDAIANRPVAILFADIIGFTGLAERMPADGVIALLRDFQGRATEIVFRHGGTLDKYIGDGLMATFGTLGAAGNPAAQAVACALDLQADMALWNAERRSRDAVPIRIGIGVHYGTVVVGNVGTGRRLEFTVVGDPVNVASRLERLTREVQAAIVLSEATVKAAGDHCPLPDGIERRTGIMVPGRVEPIDIVLVFHPAEGGAETAKETPAVVASAAPEGETANGKTAEKVKEEEPLGKEAR